MTTVTVAATQMACSWDKAANLAKAEELIRSAAAKGANIILIQELFETPYFCIEVHESHLDLATTLEENTAFARFQALAKELNVVLPFSWFEQAGVVRFNSVAMIDAGGELLGVYRKTHIPESDGYLEKYYFSPGDTGFKVWQTRFGKVGVGICWDQWFPETARAMALMGADILLFPTAIGSEPSQPDWDSMPHWTNAMRGHAASNVIPVVASNRIGSEKALHRDLSLDFFGSSFICDERGELIWQASRRQEEILVHSFDLEAIAKQRQCWGLFRDRRPEHYGPLQSMTGK
ncbi:N-carbamoylputrescine amidase [Maribrevibacterium harenarium]|uniref:N-carbamoylputrescine amidase n=1 Tax=Maribrevibacterium harenarium TaxID=2589817 RepID=A0A501X4A8_9GAMM|nr:N-carbamoylputrescine amidase [Maribrevibacterium harenarium]TPE55314.1 N-carbamoylputrescine amidase [Maribrevibacterium harenarium]